MSYSVVAYRVNTQALARIFGSGDNAMLSKLERDFREDIDENGRWFERDIGKGAPTLSQALAEILSGKIELASPRWAFQYTYALELLCKAVGTGLDSGPFSTIDPEWLRQIGVLEPAFANGPPVTIPLSRGFPSVGHLTAEMARRQKQELESSETAAQSLQIEDAREHYLCWLAEAVKEGEGIVVFYY